MPIQAKKCCPNCGRGYSGLECPSHPRTDNRPPELNKLYGRRWKALRKQILEDNPLCIDCLKEGKTEVAREVHHTIRHHGNPQIFWNSPLEPLCEKCHDKKTALERR